MNLEISEHQVFTVEQIVTKNQTAIVKKHYKMLSEIVLTYDSITQKVKASVNKFNLETLVYEFDSTFQEDLIFDYEGTTFNVNAVNGLAEIDFIVSVGTHTVTTVNGKIKNGEVIIVV